jgi:anti-sigma-K factor RskA
LNIEEYISSGILEAYVLGDVSEQERAEVEDNLRRYPQLRDELERVEAAQESLLMRAAIQPRHAVKINLMRQIEKSTTEGEKVAESKVVSIARPGNVKWWQLATAASLSAAVIASYAAFHYRTELTTAQESLSNLISQNQQIASDYNVVNQRLDKIEGALKIIESPAYKRVVMKGTDAAKNALASVYWNESTSEVYLSIQELRTLSQDQQFQLWAIVDGKPVDAGVFSLSDDLIKMKNINNASAFAVTIEPAGGSVSPTLSSMQVVGTI